MTTVAKLVAAFAGIMQIEESVVRNKIRAMQDAEILPLATGRSIPEITPHHLAAAILGVLGSDKVKDAPKAYNRLHALADRRNPDGLPSSIKERIGQTQKLGDWLTAQIDFAIEFKQDTGWPGSNSESIYQVVINWPEFEFSCVNYDATDPDKIPYRRSTRFRDHSQLDGWQSGCKHSYSFNGVTFIRLVKRVFEQSNLND